VAIRNGLTANSSLLPRLCGSNIYQKIRAPPQARLFFA
jgi:hypothetical protein